ncbi:glutamine-hydrolyzing carbamoyl-phosphate synthase small subunit [Bifidobacterium xylocopae]|uniref:Carbamoyl phosphate synthase small chain n=1 Tax=Bifidobacterium xylocopae TaxID=2493119 RepID=A0A366KDZ9_9BIFI|nr:glutamine-hydrolyzing carbamoyl-phosphate synthase small subunit [Bifidobacterium xylocopae]RBP99924.1 carbamoyl phosphate synthase small subunit [Bifidobacterium xylocopae]
MNLQDATTIAADSHSRARALLVLEDGEVYAGDAYGALGQTQGEIVFSTGMTGYQETLTDPSYDRQIVVQTFPHIGDTGINGEDGESGRVWVAGYVVREPSPTVSNWRSDGSLDGLLVDQGIVGISHMDTRRLVRHLRSAGAMRAGIFSGAALQAENGRPLTTGELLETVRRTPRMEGSHLTGEVSATQAYTLEPSGDFEGSAPVCTVAAVDLGLKAMTPRLLAERGCRVHVLPVTTTLEDIRSLHPDGVFFSNGPGDPGTADREVDLVRGCLDAGLPLFGICLGNQLLGRALGFGTYKLKFGHRGINQPVKDLTSGRVEVTAHNHGFAVDAPLGGPVPAPYGGGRYGRVRVSHVDLNDDVVEGLECIDIPAFSVQYHPEAAAGPHDAIHLFDRFVGLMKGSREDEAHA